MNDHVALIGLGQMGLPIATQLTAAFDVLAFDISPERRALASREDRIEVTEELSRLALADTIVVSLPTPVISRTVLTDLIPHLTEGAIIIETSTVLPDDVREWQRLLAPKGARVVDAAVLSGVTQMEQGKATLLVGGEASDLDAVDTVLSIIGGAGVQRFGELGAGMAAKVINNGVAHAVMVVLVEAFAMAKAEGVALEDIASMLDREDGGLQRPLNHRIMQRVAGANFEGGMPLGAARKDSTLALSMAQRSGTPLFVTQAAQTVYDIASGNGLDRSDYSAVAQLWENWTSRHLTYEKRDR